jgi:hypothetical protein
MLIERNGYEFQIDFDHPNYRFKGGKTPKLPPQPDPVPVPESIQEGAALAGETEARLRKKQKGRKSTILTEGLGTTDTNQAKSVLLG